MKTMKTSNYKKLKYFIKISSKRGAFKYKCDNCGEFTYLTKRDRDRVAIPRCRFCESTWLEPVTDSAIDKMQEGYNAYNTNVDKMREKMNY